ncbi:MAG: amidohydrolase family protein [Gemmatimonadetes bacterium]|nr:amidohydrolase family protein [Gemmatimonadota bacterium]
MGSGRSTVYRANWVLPVVAPPFRDGAVLVDGSGLIAAVGHRAVIDPPEGAEVVEFGEAALLPGLVNVHSHLELAMFRGALEELSFRDWILRLVGGKRSVLEDGDYAAAARWTALEAIRAGMTTLATTEASGIGMAAMQEAGLRGIVYNEVFGPDPEQAEASVRGLQERLDGLRPHETELVRVGISPHAPYTVSDDLFRAAALLSREEEIPIAIHIAESAIERELVTRGEGDFAPGLRARGIATPVRGRSPVEMLDRLGALAARPLLIHCVDVDDEDIRRIADTDCAVAHCPVANAKLGHGLAPLAALLGAGVRVGLGTDSVASNNRLDLLEEARFAALLQRAAHRTPTLLSAPELLRLCTLDGARALGMEDRIGSLEPGKDADLCAVSLAAPHVKPIHDPVTALFHSARGTDVTFTAVRGRALYLNGMVSTIDAPAAERRMEEAAARLRELT